jgi:pimeloyl-ACP methyl ester carboxylesterase
LGGGIAAELAVREPVGGLVLESTFTSVPDMGAEFFPWLPVRWLASIRYDTHSKLPQLHLPVLVMHSPVDELVGFRHGKANFAAANEPKLFWELKGYHNDPLADPKHFIAGIDEFLTMVETHGPAGSSGAGASLPSRSPDAKAN